MNRISANMTANLLANLKKTNYGVGDDAPFADILGASLRRPADFNRQARKELDKLAERFPGLGIASGKVADGIKGAKDYYAGIGETDRVTLDESILAGMLDGGSLAKMVEDAIAGFLGRDPDGGLMTFGDSVYASRSLTITLTAIRYGEYHYSRESGEMLAASELKTDFSEYLTELIRKFFGGANPADGAVEGTTEKGGGTEAAAGAKRPDGLPWGAAGMWWSLEIYYSASCISSAVHETDSESGPHSPAASWNAGASYSASLITGITSHALPGALARESSSLRPFLENLLSGFGLEAGNLRSDPEGHFLTLRQRRNLLSELLELYQGKIRQIGIEKEMTAEAV